MHSADFEPFIYTPVRYLEKPQNGGFQSYSFIDLSTVAETKTARWVYQ